MGYNFIVREEGGGIMVTTVVTSREGRLSKLLPSRGWVTVRSKENKSFNVTCKMSFLMLM